MGTNTVFESEASTLGRAGQSGRKPDPVLASHLFNAVSRVALGEGRRRNLSSWAADGRRTTGGGEGLWRAAWCQCCAPEWEGRG